MTRYFADLSNNNAHADFGAYRKAGHRVVALKATEGTGYVDPLYRERVVDARRHGLAVLHYHFARPDTHPAGTDEARAFMATIAPHIAAGDRVVLDVEIKHPAGALALAAYVREFEHVVDQHGHALIAYSYTAFMAEAGAALQTHSRRWWVADYAPRLTLPRWLRSAWAWQRTDGVNGPEPRSCAGIGRCDVSLMSRRAYLSIRAAQLRHRRR